MCKSISLPLAIEETIFQEFIIIGEYLLYLIGNKHLNDTENEDGNKIYKQLKKKQYHSTIKCHRTAHVTSKSVRIQSKSEYSTNITYIE